MRARVADSSSPVAASHTSGWVLSRASCLATALWMSERHLSVKGVAHNCFHVLPEVALHILPMLTAGAPGPVPHFSLRSQRGPSWFHSHHGPAHAALWLTPGGEAGLFVLDLRLLQAWAWPTRHLPSLPTPGTQPSVRSLSTSPLTLKGAAPSSSLPVRTIFPAAFHSASCLSFTPQLEGPLSARLPSPSCPSNLLSCSLLARASAAHSTIEI